MKLSPLEVDRYLYRGWSGHMFYDVVVFPAPLEVDRELYPMSSFIQEIKIEFPAPREVDRDLYRLSDCT